MNNREQTFRMKQNKRIYKYTALVADPGDSTQKDCYADIPAGNNAAKFVGFLNNQHFIEPGGLYFVAQNTDPTTVTGAATSTYNLAGKNATLVVEGPTYGIAADGNIAEGDLLVIADAYGRVWNLASAGIGAGQHANVVAKAMQPSANANDIIRLRVLDVPAQQ